MEYPEDIDLYDIARTPVVPTYADLPSNAEPPAVFRPVHDLVMTWDEEAQGWMGTSPSVPGLITCATTQDELREQAAMCAWHLLKPLTAAEQAIVDRARADPIAAYHASREAKAQRVAAERGEEAENDGYGSDPVKLAERVAVRDEFLVESGMFTAFLEWLVKRPVAEPEDLPTLPTTALNTWGA